jgi:hypothetical protein
MRFRNLLVSVLLLAGAGLTACDRDQTAQPQIRKVTYSNDVEPILRIHCVECHENENTGAVESGLRLDTYQSLMKGSRLGPVVKPGSALTSSLYILISGKDELTVNMPHGNAPLSAEDIETIRLWIDSGAAEN